MIQSLRPKPNSQGRVTSEEPLGMRDTSDNSDTEEEQMEIEQEEEVEAEICAQCANLLKRKSRGGRPNDLLSVS